MSSPALIEPSQFRGVQRTLKGRYTARVSVDGSAVYAGTWMAAEDAAIAVDRVLMHFRESPKLNVPDKSTTLGPASPAELVVEARRRSKRAHHSSKYFGVFLSGDDASSWHMVIHRPNERTLVTKFRDELTAARAYDRLVLHLGLERPLNFPDECLAPASRDELRREAGRVVREEKTSRFRGVYWYESREQWTAMITLRARRFSLGYFEEESDAARAYDTAAWNALGKEALLNFEPPSETPTGEMPKPHRKVRLSAYKGVTRQGDRFIAQVGHGGGNVHLGVWPTEQDAALARDRAVLHFELDRDLNLPEASTELGAASPEELRHSSLLLLREHTASCYFGVVLAKPNRYSALVYGHDGERVCIGEFREEEAAAVARDRLWLYLGHDPSLLNFPDRTLTPASADELRREVRAIFKRTTTSRFRGVALNRQKTRWIAYVGHGPEREYLGTFEVEEDAALAYDNAARRVFGTKALLNFP